MPTIKKTGPSDKRGNVSAGSKSRHNGNARKGTEHEGVSGNLPHERNEQAAGLVEMLKGFGLTLNEISCALERQFGRGYTVATLERHYRDEIERGMAVAKSQLMQRAYRMAMGENVPPGVSPDKAYEISSRKLSFLLNVVHGVRPSAEGLSGGAIQIVISGDDAEL